MRLAQTWGALSHKAHLCPQDREKARKSKKEARHAARAGPITQRSVPLVCLVQAFC